MVDQSRLLDLIAAVRAHPRDNRPRRALANWLERQGDPRGEWIQLQVTDDSGLDQVSSNWVSQFSQFASDETERRETELFRNHRRTWFGTPPHGVEIHVDRGLLHLHLFHEILPLTESTEHWFRDQQLWIESLSFDTEEILEVILQRGFLSQVAVLHIPFDLMKMPLLADQTQIRSLHLYGANIKDDWFDQISRLHSLQSLELTGCTSFVGTGLIAAAALSELEHLTVNGSFTDFSGIAALKSLRRLKVKFRTSTEKAGLGDRLCREVARLDSLQSFNVTSEVDQGVTNEGLRELRSMHELKSLSLQIASRTDLSLLAELLNLEELTVTGAGVTDDQLKNLAKLKSLRALNFWGKEVTGIGLPAISNLSELECLRHLPLRVLTPEFKRFSSRKAPQQLEFNGELVTDECMSSLLPLVQLRELDLHNTAVTGKGVELLVQLPRLESVFVKLEQLQEAQPEILGGWTSLRRLNITGGGVSLRPLSNFRGLPRLSIALHLYDPEFNETELAFLAGMTQIKILDLSDCEPMTDIGIANLADLTAIQELDLHGSDINEMSLQHLSGMWDLRDLRLGRIPIEGGGLVFLTTLTQLIDLRLNHTGCTDAGMFHLASLKQLEHLDLYRSRVTDEGLQHLTSLGQLRSLNLSYSRITDSGLEYLMQVTSLEHLWLDGTDISVSGVKSLQQKLPQCSIRYSPN